jgi:acyl carrier protein
MTEDQIRASVKEFIGRFFRGHDLRYDEDIFAVGFVNSMFAMQLVNFVEREFGVAVVDEDLDLENFRTVDAIAALVVRKRGGGGD